jgi:hypothetical protein
VSTQNDDKNVLNDLLKQKKIGLPLQKKEL